MITAQHLEVRAGARLLMGDVSFRVAAGDKVGLVGRNGAGKTTLTRILAGEDAGEGRLAGAVAADETDLVAGRDPEADVPHQQSCPGPDFEVLGGDHQGR